MLEGVHRGATKLIKCMENLHTKKDLVLDIRHSGLMSLETRRVRDDMIEVYKV